MFFSRIYGSWRNAQRDKYAWILDKVGEGIFSGKILDIGAGPGYLGAFLAERKIPADVVALDIEKPADVIADGGKMPFKDDVFDTVVSVDAMHLIEGIDFRVLKKGGFALLAIFFNSANYEERKALLKNKLGGFQVISEFELRGRENEYVILGRK